MPRDRESAHPSENFMGLVGPLSGKYGSLHNVFRVIANSTMTRRFMNELGVAIEQRKRENYGRVPFRTAKADFRTPFLKCTLVSDRLRYSGLTPDSNDCLHTSPRQDALFPALNDAFQWLDDLNEADQPIRPLGLDERYQLKNRAKSPSIVPRLVTTQIKAEARQDEETIGLF
jgi:hypothetical protein